MEVGLLSSTQAEMKTTVLQPFPWRTAPVAADALLLAQRWVRAVLSRAPQHAAPGTVPRESLWKVQPPELCRPRPAQLGRMGGGVAVPNSALRPVSEPVVTSSLECVRVLRMKWGLR